jgi:hypothetical protein
MIATRITRAILLGQYVLLLGVAYGEAQTLGYQLRHDGYYPLGCIGLGISNTLPPLLIEAVGTAGVLGLLAGRSWARWPYGVLVVAETWVLWDLLRSSSLEVDLPGFLLVALYASSVFIVTTFYTRPHVVLRPKSA